MVVNLRNDLKGFFLSHQLEVIDKRPKGGALWVVGCESQIDDIVEAACRRFGIDGYYALNGGRATNHRTAWFTTWDR